mgnify:CR=1 FL=1
MKLDPVRLANHIRSQFQLDWEGIHGPSHWARVRAMGLELAHVTGADPVVVELFAWFHDSRRFNDENDPEHGDRAAAFACELRGDFFEATDEPQELMFVLDGGEADSLLRAVEDADIEVFCVRRAIDYWQLGARD